MGFWAFFWGIVNNFATCNQNITRLLSGANSPERHTEGEHITGIKFMANERKTENLVRNLLKSKGYYDDKNIIVEEQASDHPKIDKLLKSASKSGKGRGYPEFIIRFKDNPDNVVVIECKADISKHESKNRKKYKDYAVDGAILYASCLKDEFNVMAIAVSGQNKKELKISQYLWLKGVQKYTDSNDKTILKPQSLFKVIEKQSAPIREEDLIKKAIEYNKQLHSYSINEADRCTIISSILVALQDRAFSNSFKQYHAEEDTDNYNPNKAFIDALLGACKRVLEKRIHPKKMDIIMQEYQKIQSNYKLSNEYDLTNKTQEKNTILRDLVDDVNNNIMPYISKNVYDVLGKFYTQFIRYAGSNKKTGLVLTPPHITDFFCEVADLNENNIIFDPCCGTGGFLVSAMKYMLDKSGNDLDKHKKIRTNQLIGIEIRSEMFSHACSNMMMRGDGKSNIHFGDCFDPKLIKDIKKQNPDKAFLNPPYNGGASEQLEFVETALDCIEKDGICVSICQMSVAISDGHDTIEIKKRLLKKHTLLAVFSMPNDLFHPAAGVITCIIIFKAHSPHPVRKETFFGYYKDDGFVKIKNKGRLDINNKWQSLKEEWLNAYQNSKNVEGLSVTKCVGAEDEWCAEAYMKTDYSKITQASFEDVIKKYALFNLMNG